MRDTTEFKFDKNSQDIFENVFTFFGTLTPDGYVLSLTGKVFERTATAPELLIGQKFSETVYWQSTEQTSNTLEQAIIENANGQKTKTTLDFRVNSQEKIIIELFLQPIQNSQAATKLLFFCAQDVTSREKEIAFQKNRSEQMLYAAENADTGLWFWDLSEDRMFVTPKCSELFEISSHEMFTSQSMMNIVHPKDRTEVENTFRDSQVTGKPLNIEYRVIYSDNKIRWICVRGKTYFDGKGNPRNITGIVRGISDNEISNEELSIVYAREKKARDEAEEANRAKDFFLAVVSHELRSPLNAILGWSKILLTKEVDKETTKNALETIEKSARSQAKLIEDLLDSARVASGKLRMEFRSINLYEIIKTVCNLQKSIAEAKKINLEFHSDKDNVQVFGDAARLQQVFNNLLSNALKFTKEGNNIQVDVKTGDEIVQVFVKDTGQGISAETLPTIFNQFHQGDESTTRDSSGLGLGLSIVKILVEKHQGKVWVESEGIGHGSTFIVTLPLCGSEIEITEEIKQFPSNEDKLLDKIKILVVEDDPDSREVLQLLLEQSGAKVKSAKSASEAINLLKKSQTDLPDVIVSDLAMPDEDGYSMLARIRKLSAESGGKIPALALSAFATNENKQKAYDAGFQKYHTKPFEPDGIIQDILQLLEK
ncbi:MAG TPA: ATP-binding protein [Pyrinomonadaceae bacterium]|nr:ATP-binding protein [Pyrinomonadaceae bacterium]